MLSLTTIGQWHRYLKSCQYTDPKRYAKKKTQYNGMITTD